ncbi:dTDP-4-dehydrorhamnose reductase [Terribacillus aidingensis]|uniref:dTDP-4-dehydrorhamnose reductase n=1 Tax=Terribacillus aidingensis TaxID=586416 RepID=A0A285N7D9_9BACI|nr:dTDP-4-dehydrorhamnose reductase [Terribacillus aidingensis]SNZ04777.1 dTDP-4-dehydrorhamnose reductase [Terribacillus aidingensis]
MKILVTGHTGQLGYDVVEVFKYEGYEVKGVSTKDFNLTNFNEVNNFVESFNPDCIVHCAAYTKVDQAEIDTEICWEVNVEGSVNLIEAAKKINSKIIFISSDYVFSGTGNFPYNEYDKTQPINYYGLTKEKIEKYLAQNMEDYCIVRISWVFGKNGSNFVDTMIKLSQSKDELRVVDDQIGSPTYTVDAARFLLSLFKSNKSGIYHATNTGYCSWADFATEIFKQKSINTVINRVTSDEFKTLAVRPKNSRLSNSGEVYQMPTWQDALSRYLDKG